MGFSLGGIARFAGKVAGKIKGVAGKAVAATVPGGGAIMAGGSMLGKLGKRVNRKVLKGAVIGAGAAGAGALAMGAFHGGPASGRRYRRMNPMNPRALRRAFRRVEAGARIMGRFYHVKHGTIKGAHGVRPKFRRRRAA